MTVIWKHRPTIALMMVVALLALLLAGLQYHWVGQVSQGEHERMQANLRVGAARFSEDFDRELARAYLSFQMDAATLRDRAWDRYAQRYTRWSETAPYPRMVGDVFLVEVNEIGRISLSHFNPATKRFEPSDWPVELTELRRNFEQAYQSTHLESGLAVSNSPGPVVQEIPALVIPLSRSWLLSDREDIDLDADILFANTIVTRPRSTCLRCKSPAASDPLLAHTIVTLDHTYLTQEFIPILARRYFSRGTENDYNLAIVSRAGQKLVYQSDPAMSEAALASGDATANLLGVRFDELNRLLLDNAQRPEDPSGSAEQQPERIAIGILGPLPRQGDRAGSMSQANEGHWELIVSHRAGSLDAAVARLRNQNLLLSFGVLLLLAASMVMLIVSTERAQRLARQKMEFVAAVSHELRTPLAVICSAGENLADGIVHDLGQARQYGTVIRSEGRRLTEMVEQALEFAGAQSGRQTYQLCPVDVLRLVESALAACRAALEPSNALVEREFEPDLPLVNADAPALRRAIENLIGNAVKYGGQRPSISIKARTVSTGRRREIQIIVQDHGLGIDPADLPYIFEPFYRGREVVAAQIHGSGLGLSLVRQIVEAHGGRVYVESAPGQGSRFTLQLPAFIPEVSPQTSAEGIV